MTTGNLGLKMNAQLVNAAINWEWSAPISAMLVIYPAPLTNISFSPMESVALNAVSF